MPLGSKSAIVHGGDTTMGAAIAISLAAEGAWVFLAGADATRIEETAAAIRREDGRAETAVVDPLDEAAVRDHAEAIMAQAGGIDVAAQVTQDGANRRPVSVYVHTAMALARGMVAHATGTLLYVGVHEANGADCVVHLARAATLTELRDQWGTAADGVRCVSLCVSEPVPEIGALATAQLRS
jgi:3-oxoacyl-[acyl-carrier protein] reductase